MVDTKKLPLTERYAFELGRKKAIADFGNTIVLNITGKKIEHINSNDLAKFLTIKQVLEFGKNLLQENAQELLSITKEVKDVLENKDVKKNN